MAKHKLTVTDLESGEVLCERDFDFFMGSICLHETDKLPEPESFSFGSKASALDVIASLIADDDIRGKIFADHHVVAQGYSIRNKLFRDRVVIDLSELKKQTGAV